MKRKVIPVVMLLSISLMAIVVGQQKHCDLLALNVEAFTEDITDGDDGSYCKYMDKILQCSGIGVEVQSKKCNVDEQLSASSPIFGSVSFTGHFVRNKTYMVVFGKYNLVSWPDGCAPFDGGNLAATADESNNKKLQKTDKQN